MVKCAKVFTVLLSAVLLSLPLIGCGERAETAEELIPAVLGEPEGLWLYKGGFRSRTDGSENERLFNGVEIDGTEYSCEDILFKDYIYCPAAHNVYYLLNTEAYGNFLYGFDYLDKTGKFLCDAPDGRVEFTVSDGLIYARFDGAGFLFDGQSNLLCGEICGTLENGVLYAVRVGESQSCYLDWYYNGLHTAVLPDSDGFSAYGVEIYGDYIYLTAGNTPRYAVEKNTGKVTNFDIFGVSFDPDEYVDSYRSIQERFYYGDTMYVFSVVYCIIDRGDENREQKDEWYWYLHRIDGDKAALACEFGEVRKGMSMGADAGMLYFEARTMGNLYQTYYRYDPATGKLKKISKREYRGGGIPKIQQPSDSRGDKTVEVNGYKFSVSSLPYGYGGFLNSPEGYCYYLNREHDGVKEIMQYSFQNGYFYDDICGF